jgi:hypothetical protein
MSFSRSSRNPSDVDDGIAGAGQASVLGPPIVPEPWPDRAVSEYCASSSTAVRRSAGPFTSVRPSSHASGVGTSMRTSPFGCHAIRGRRRHRRHDGRRR